MSTRETVDVRRVIASDGTELVYRAWPAAAPRGAILVVHGLFEHSRRYAELGATMAEAGLSTFAVDLRGHGQSGGQRGHVRRFGDYLDDVDRFRLDVERMIPGDLPRVLLGHSMGGLVAIRYLEEHDVPWAGAVITSPWLELAAEVPAWQRVMAVVLDRVLPRFPFPSNLDPDDLSHDPERVADYRNDPVIHTTITPRVWMEVARAADRARDRVESIAVPALFMIAGGDRVVRADRGVELARSLPDGDVTIQVLNGYYHEVLQETDRTAVITEIQQWIEARLS